MHKSRFIHKPQLDRSHRVIPIPKGGHDGVTAPEGADNINLLTNSMINQSLGVAGSDANNLISIAQMPSGLNGNASANIEGLTSLEINQQTTYFITDYETFLAYTITAIRGVVSRVGDTITYTAPSSVGPGGFIINGRAVNIPITASFSVNTPVITSPVNNATGLSTSPSFTSNAFGLSGSSDTHEGSDWQIATDAGFTNIVSQVTNSATNKLNYNASGLSSNTTYYVRVRYKGTIYGYSNWATAVTFTTQTIGTVNQPTITSPANGATGVAVSPSFTSTAFVVSTGSDTHEGSDWQIATDAGFTTIVAQTTNSAVNKTTYSIAGLSGGVTYYARVRYKGLAFGYSAWSPTVSFTVISVPTYSVVPTATTLNEGGNVNFNITTSNVANGTVLYWTIDGNNVTSGDFTSGDISGSVIINNNTASVSKTLSNDITTEGVETFVFNLRTGSTSGTIVANSGTITINDASISANTAPAITNYSPEIQFTNLSAINLFPNTVNITDNELNLTNNWSGSKIVLFCNAGMEINFTGGVVTLEANSVKHNNVTIGSFSNQNNNDVHYTISFGAVTKQQVIDVLKAITYDRYNINNLNSRYTVTVTIYDGNTGGAQGSGGELNTAYDIQINTPAGTLLSEGCTYYEYSYMKVTADGNGGTDDNSEPMSYMCGWHDWTFKTGKQSTGKILSISRTSNQLSPTNGTSRWQIVRVNTNNSLDTTFGTNGYFRLGANYPLLDFAILQNDKIAVIYRSGSNNRLLILSANGQILSDTINKPSGYADSTYEMLIPLSNGSNKLLILGFKSSGYSDYHGVISQFNDNGTVDTGFATYESPSIILPFLNSAVNSGKFNNAQSALYFSGNPNIIKFNYTATGITLDSTYGNNGASLPGAIPNVSSFAINCEYKNIIFQSNNKILTHDGDVILRFNTDGTIDTTFGNGGKLLSSDLPTDNGGYPTAIFVIHDIIIQPDENISVLWNGRDYYNEVWEGYAISRLLPTGLRDSSYTGSNNKAKLPIGIVVYDVNNQGLLLANADNTVTACLHTDGNRNYKFTTVGLLDGSF